MCVVTVCFETPTETEQFQAEVETYLGIVVWNLSVWWQSMTTYTFPQSGNVYLVAVCFATLTEAETLLDRVVGRVVWGSLFEI